MHKKSGAKLMYKIMIVEDDSVIAGAIARHMESWGCEVHCVENFQKVTAEFAAFDPQLVLLDISLPFFNGYHWCSEIRHFYLLCVGQHEYRDGHEHGRRRLYRKAL